MHEQQKNDFPMTADTMQIITRKENNKLQIIVQRK